MALRVTCYGGAETVTGSNFLVEGTKGKLLVDCGIEQGRDFVAAEMYAPFPFDVPAIDALVITHAHLDHIGRTPKLMKEGFKGKVYCTAPTADLMDIMLRDTARILADDARRDNLPILFDERDIDALMARVVVTDYHKEWEAAPGLSCYLRNTGHILGSASVRITDEEGTSMAFTGDIGNAPNPYLPDPEPVTDAGVVLMESVYGDRANPQGDRVGELREALKRAAARGGAILMPAFSIERTQLLLYEMHKMFEAGELPKMPVFLDSPLAIHATQVYEKWGEKFFKAAAVEEDHRLHGLFEFPFLQMTESRQDSEEIDVAPFPKIIMAGAGMSHGGRIGRWEQKYLPDPKTTVFIVGYQAPGSPGRLIQDHAPSVRIEGKDVRVRAKVETYHGWSGHADRDGLLDFAAACKEQGSAKLFFVGLGEPASARFLAQRIHDYLGAKAIVPKQGDAFIVDGTDVRRA